MSTKLQKRATLEVITLPEALNDFYQASHHNCNGNLATVDDVFKSASEADIKLQQTKRQSFLAKANACLQSMKSFADSLDGLDVRYGKKTSHLIWGCLVHLLEASLRSACYMEKVAEMFHNIGNFGTDELEHTAFLTLANTRQMIPSLYAWTLICCASALRAMKRKREKFRTIIGNEVIKPFGFKYDYPLSQFQQHRQHILSEFRQAERSNLLSTPAENRLPVCQSDLTINRETPMPGLRILPQGLVADRELLVLGLERGVRKGVEGEVKGLAAFISWLQPPDYETAFREARKHQMDDLILWVKKQGEYIEWSQSKASGGGLLIHGAEGIGKTALTAAIIKDVEQRIDAVNTARLTGYGLCYFFITSPNTTNEVVTNMLKCFVAQLMQQTTVALSLELAADYLANPTPTYDIVRNFLVSLVKYFRRVHIIVDGLNHACHPEVVANALADLYNKLWPVMKLLVVTKAIPLKVYVAGLRELALPE